MKSYRYLHLDVFTDRRFGGNQLAVVLDGRGLSTDTMQEVTKELKFSESTFVLPSEQSGTDARLRIFNPVLELPIAGHPTIGSTFALAHAGVIEPGRERFVFGLGVGPVPVTLAWRGKDLSFVWMTQPVPTFGDPIPYPGRVAAALGLSEAAVAGSGLPVQVGSSGAPFLFVPLTTRRAVDSAAVDGARLAELFQSANVDAHGVFIFSTERGDDKATVYSRMFAPNDGIPEDPATGGASGPLGCYLVRHNVVPPEKAGAMLSLQGVAMGRPSRIHISIGMENGETSRVRVGGESVLVADGTLYI